MYLDLPCTAGPNNEPTMPTIRWAIQCQRVSLFRDGFKGIDKYLHALLSVARYLLTQTILF